VIAVIIECTTCPVGGVRCDDCMVTALLTPSAPDLRLDAAEESAVQRFVRAGLLDPAAAEGLTARREPWRGSRAVG
jgi:hypothetical protein